MEPAHHSDTIRELASILNPQNEARPTILLGAGASFSSGVPLADESVRRIARRYYAERVVGGRVLPEQVKTSEWMAWLTVGAKHKVAALQAADFLAYTSYLEVRDDIENGHESKVIHLNGIDFELVAGCGLTVIENLIRPKDMTSMRENFLRKKKLPVFGHAFLDGGIALLKGGRFTVEPSSVEARYAGLRAPLKN